VADLPFWQQRGWQFSAVFLAVMLVCAGVVTVVSGGPDSGAGAVSERRSARSPAASVPTARGPAAAAPTTPIRSTPVQPPTDVTWQPLNGGKIPLSATAGPLLTSGPVLWCFAHTPMGAVMAANVIPRQMSGGDWRDHGRAAGRAGRIARHLRGDAFVPAARRRSTPPGRWPASC
jgi:hypothetical protein